MRDRQTWAYCDVRPDGTITYYGVARAHRTQARPNIHAVDTTRWVEEAVAWLGLQGWELVNVVQTDERTFYFKRPVDEQEAEVAAERLGTVTAGVSAAEVTEVLDDEPGERRIDPVRLVEEEFLPD